MVAKVKNGSGTGEPLEFRIQVDQDDHSDVRWWQNGTATEI